MPRIIDYSNQAGKFLNNLCGARTIKGRAFRVNIKQCRQIKEKIESLLVNSFPPDSIQLDGKTRRATIGEYRIVYEVEGSTLYVIVIARRNDNEVYKVMRRQTKV